MQLDKNLFNVSIEFKNMIINLLCQFVVWQQKYLIPITMAEATAEYSQYHRNFLSDVYKHIIPSGLSHKQ